MTGQDLDDLEHRLQGLAVEVERTTTPVEPERVRRLGDRRRHRRHALTAAAAVVVAGLAGGVVLSQTPGLTTQVPPPVASGPTAVPVPVPTAPAPSASTSVPAPTDPTASGGPTPSATSPSSPDPTSETRRLGTANLLRAGDVPTSGGPALEVAPQGTGRDLDEVSVCIPDGLSVLGATDTAARDFRYPEQERPAIQTVALQFVDAAAAREAEQTVENWVDDCVATLEDRGATVLGEQGPEWLDVDTTAGTSGRFAVLPIYREADQSGEDGVFESLGVTRVDDRLMLTVRANVGMDDNVSLEAEPDPADGMQPHPQFGLVAAAAERLAA